MVGPTEAYAREISRGMDAGGMGQMAREKEANSLYLSDIRRRCFR